MCIEEEEKEGSTIGMHRSESPTKSDIPSNMRKSIKGKVGIAGIMYRKKKTG